METWRRDLDETLQREILEVVEDSPVFERGVAEAGWDAGRPVTPLRRAA